MLIITRRVGQEVLLKTDNGLIRVVVKKGRRNGRTQLAIDAPTSVHVLRGELVLRGEFERRRNLAFDEATQEWVCSDAQGNEVWREADKDIAESRLDVADLNAWV